MSNTNLQYKIPMCIKGKIQKIGWIMLTLSLLPKLLIKICFLKSMWHKLVHVLLCNVEFVFRVLQIWKNTQKRKFRLKYLLPKECIRKICQTTKGNESLHYLLRVRWRVHNHNKVLSSYEKIWFSYQKFIIFLLLHLLSSKWHFPIHQSLYQFLKAPLCKRIRTTKLLERVKSQVL